MLRFEYKYSFKPPYLAQKDGSVPFFEYSGNAIASEEMVRITPSLRSQKGEFFVPYQVFLLALYNAQHTQNFVSWVPVPYPSVMCSGVVPVPNVLTAQSYRRCHS